MATPGPATVTVPGASSPPAVSGSGGASVSPAPPGAGVRMGVDGGVFFGAVGMAVVVGGML